MRLDTAEKRAAYRACMIPKDSARDSRSTDKAEVYSYMSAGKPCARAFVGTSAHPAWHYSFRTEAQREQHIAEFFSRQSAHNDMMAERKTKRDAFRHTMKVGDLVHTSWGYDQTNVEFFEVVRVVSERSVAVREVAAHQVETGFMCGNIGPIPGKYIGEEHIRRVREGNVVVHVLHSRYDGYPCGTEAQRNSWYA